MVLPTDSTTVDDADLPVCPTTMIWSLGTLAYADNTMQCDLSEFMHCSNSYDLLGLINYKITNTLCLGAFKKGNKKLGFSFTMTVLGVK